MGWLMDVLVRETMTKWHTYGDGGSIEEKPVLGLILIFQRLPSTLLRTKSGHKIKHKSEFGMLWRP